MSVDSGANAAFAPKSDQNDEPARRNDDIASFRAAHARIDATWLASCSRGRVVHVMADRVANVGAPIACRLAAVAVVAESRRRRDRLRVARGNRARLALRPPALSDLADPAVRRIAIGLSAMAAFNACSAMAAVAEPRRGGVRRATKPRPAAGRAASRLPRRIAYGVVARQRGGDRRSAIARVRRVACRVPVFRKPTSISGCFTSSSLARFGPAAHGAAPVRLDLRRPHPMLASNVDWGRRSCRSMRVFVRRRGHATCIVRGRAARPASMRKGGRATDRDADACRDASPAVSTTGSGGAGALP
ncbi:Uncharacterised protein [Burkholderia oklahomensis]|nr:hypothetical protein BG90_5253 [Burkholderia oklahomensis C6786]SUY26977.1 Uncharacterised protein [Burkholderia oklahomensis]